MQSKEMELNLKRKPGTLGAAVLAFALTVTGCTTTTTSTPAQELTYAPGLFPVALDVQTYPAEEGVQTTAQQVLETLVTFSEGSIEPLLAESWENPDPLTWKFKLREANFSDGSPFTANDVKASLDRLIALKGVLTPLLSAITEIRADDDRTFTIVTSESVGTLPSTLSLVFIGKASGVNDPTYWTKPVGTGPFMVSEYVADDHVTLVRNDNYWGDKARLDRVNIVNMPEISSKITALTTGEVDIVTSIPPDQVGNIEGASGIDFSTKESYQYYFTWFNQTRPPFNDVKIRQAMWHALNNDTIKNLFGDGATVARAPITQAVFGAPELEPYTQDLDKARRLLAEAGFPNGFAATMQYPREGGPNIRSLAQSMISDWAALGIRIEPLEKERAQWVQDLNSLNWDLNLQTNVTGTGDADFTLNRLYTCAANRMGYCNRELDSILSQARASLDQKEREELYARASKILWDDAVGIFPADLKNNAAVRSEVEGFELPVNGRPSFAPVSIGAAG